MRTKITATVTIIQAISGKAVRYKAISDVSRETFIITVSLADVSMTYHVMPPFPVAAGMNLRAVFDVKLHDINGHITSILGAEDWAIDLHFKVLKP